ncbi:MAG: nucleotide exchange factor GrpE, partial [Promethearchaeota archaeon]
EVKKNDPFDYNYHEALSSIEKEDAPENTVLDIIQDGWKLDKDVIRYTKVIISKKPKPPEPEKKKEEEKSEEDSEPENKQVDVSSDKKDESEE